MKPCLTPSETHVHLLLGAAQRQGARASEPHTVIGEDGHVHRVSLSTVRVGWTDGRTEVVFMGLHHKFLHSETAHALCLLEIFLQMDARPHPAKPPTCWCWV